MNKILVLIVICSTVAKAQAANYRNGSLSYLNGNNYEVEQSSQQTLTFEYVAGWDWMNMFMFIDSIHYKDSGSSYYGEISPRIRLYTPQTGGLVSNIYFATTFERGKDGVASDLYGIGFDFEVDGFSFLTTNIYQRDDSDISGKGYQLTTTWAYPLSVFDLPILFDGFIDWTFSTKESEENFHFNPQIKIDMKEWLKTDAQWYVGIEYDYWKNKFGLKNSQSFDTNQNTYSFLIKWHF